MYLRKCNIVNHNRGIIVHGCNASGAFGSGVAGAIRRKWPQVYKAFMENGTGFDLMGTVQLNQISANFYVANGYTQLNFGADGKRYADINSVWRVMTAAFFWADHYGLPLYAPMIGCGLGGLDWDTEIKTIFETVNENFPEISLTVCYL